MKTEQIEQLESYFKTENEHWNGYTFELLCKTIQQGSFENPETPLRLFSEAVELATEHTETPVKVIQNIQGLLEEENLNRSQKLFLYGWVSNYLANTEFEGIQLNEILGLLKSKTEHLKKSTPETNRPLTGNIRETLKELMQQEIQKLPETLKNLEPIQRLNVLCKLIPYVLPKVEPVQPNDGEPMQW